MCSMVGLSFSVRQKRYTPHITPLHPVRSQDCLARTNILQMDVALDKAAVL